LDLNFGAFHLLNIITNTLKSSAFIRMHLYQNNIDLKIDIPCSLLYISRKENEHCTAFKFSSISSQHILLKFLNFGEGEERG